MIPILFVLPWAGIAAFLLIVVRRARQLPTVAVCDHDRAPKVSVIIPARNEAENIEACLASLTKSSYPNFEIIVVNDRTEDRTAELARAVLRKNAKRLVVVDGVALPILYYGSF